MNPEEGPCPETESGLKELALEALREMLLAGKLSAGDLIKLLSMDLPEAGGEKDLVIRLVDE